MIEGGRPRTKIRDGIVVVAGLVMISAMMQASKGDAAGERYTIRLSRYHGKKMFLFGARDMRRRFLDANGEINIRYLNHLDIHKQLALTSLSCFCRVVVSQTDDQYGH